MASTGMRLFLKNNLKSAGRADYPFKGGYPKNACCDLQRVPDPLERSGLFLRGLASASRRGILCLHLWSDSRAHRNAVLDARHNPEPGVPAYGDQHVPPRWMDALVGEHAFSLGVRRGR